MKTEPMSDEEYVKHGGTKCPFCGCSDVVGDSVEINASVATQEVSCLACGSEWNDVYHLKGYTHDA